MARFPSATAAARPATSLEVVIACPRTCSDRVIRRHQSEIRLRDGQRVMSRLAFVQQFGNTEVQQFGHAIGGDQEVRGLEVAMHDEVLMRVMHRGTDGLK
jgi:hypothetical protein